MSQIVYLNGEFIPDSEAHISVHDRGFLYGDGLFDTMRAYNGVPFRIENHIERILNSAKKLKIRIELAPQNLKRIVSELLSKNRLKDAYLRITVTRGQHSGDLSFSTTHPSTILIIARPIETPSGEDYNRGVAATLVHGLSNPPELARHKTPSYLPYLLARDRASQVGAREAILVDNDGMVLETSTGNIFIVLEKEVITPPLSAGILPGIARKTALECAPDAGLETKEKPIAVKDLARAQEVFVTSSIVEILSITRVDGKDLGYHAGEITRLISNAYKKVVQEYVRAYCF